MKPIIVSGTGPTVGRCDVVAYDKPRVDVIKQRHEKLKLEAAQRKRKP